MKIIKVKCKDEFQSKAQQKFMFAKHPKLAKEFASKTSKEQYKKMPEHVKEDATSTGLLASAPDLDSIKKSISEYFGGSTITLTPTSEGKWDVATGKGPVAWAKVVIKGGRYRFMKI